MLEALSRYTLVTKILVTGGLSQKVQESSFRRQPDIVVATPGRILDILLNTPSIHIELLEIVVLDEADRLLEMGFKQEVDKRFCARWRCFFKLLLLTTNCVFSVSEDFIAVFFRASNVAFFGHVV